MQRAMSDRTIGRVRVLTGAQNGKYPQGNSLWISGNDATAIVDPSLAVRDRADELRDRADIVLLSHVHEDHVAALDLFPAATVHAHEADVDGIRSLDGLMQMYGYGGSAAAMMHDYVVDQFHYAPRADANGFAGDAVFELGGTRIRAIHTPGHTRGHCVLLIEPEGVLFLGDIELSSFGPYYGDAWSDLADFERSLDLVRGIEAKAWVSFHHVGVLDDREAFLARLDRFAARIGEREEEMIEFLNEPRTLEEMVAHRFLYPAMLKLPFVDAVERRTIEQHLARLHAAEAILETDDGRWVAAPS